MSLIDSLGTTDSLADVLSDRSVLQAMLDFEVALAQAAAEAGLIPAAAAKAIAAAAHAERFDAAAIGRSARESGTPAIALVKALTYAVRAIDPASAAFVHWGATSQDVTDSALALLLGRARPLIAADQARIDAALRRLSGEHARTVMLGRTLLQPAVPLTFGLKAARWQAAIARGWMRLAAAWDEGLVVQFGGAAGTRAAAGEHAAGMAASIGARLGLAAVPPWHAERDRFAALTCAAGLYVAALAKAATDIVLLMQAEVGEVAEPGGGSSTMPHKQNPAGSAVVVAAATRMPGLAAAHLASMVQAHERSAGQGHAEWAVMAAAVQTTGAAAAAFAAVAEGLRVDAGRMRRNLDALRGMIFAERAVFLLAGTLGRERAQSLVEEAVAKARETGENLAQALSRMPAATDILTPRDLQDLEDPERYLGDAETLRRELLGGDGL